ncbi:sugar phosphate isomerase/epimerase [Zobellia sp. 1_MG-2023]|uniref:sugar phosphate isomerase/epimerase family protein n=1 Tax=Zobellia sp. 1_MG-2023 TaxID=3062626 RepID=UPI0026E46EC3|nr:sugar phosphate isomerase/epimerase [Zobellia sp. 1_MG-2023]MDO6820267.1 sugar phosphate isomerase/epimerase [Zobellia sp. 1_MG-2023]
MRRRDFIKQSSMASAATLLPVTGISLGNPSKYKMGLQLFTIRDAMKADPLGSLKKARAMGYEDLEIYGFDPETIGYYGYEAKEFKLILDDLNLTTTSGHYDFSSYFNKPKDELRRYLDACIQGAHILNKPYITWPWLAPEFRTIENFKVLSEKLNWMAEQVNSAGLGFAYHNHDFEFTDHNGQTGYHIILKETNPQLVKLQMDMYWVMHSSKKTPQEWIAEQPGCYVMWHIKDMDKLTRDYTELGNGSIDYVDMLSKIDTNALEYYYIEQGSNFAKDSMTSIADSAKFFKKNLKQYL